ncbi:MAG TPA: Gfo/Idh/MocA family oxidoreductase [Actinophytocola sp.]|uniref:Gfo/Idh/MocA family protein n=1 Tax=Actinophytocola sp. TaxID=1872138 RepID=UPI002DBB5DB0|nr:Gfo/Idh/MocA family oxidoreductase [Actinophytocola sp.]HEU5474334.1 Gfo/Idh/MocA family oxidoreductase [Actinophytocola sp.]
MRWAVAGYGDVVVRRVLPALREAGEELAGIWGRTRARAADVAARFGIPVATTDLAELLHGVDAVYVATPVVAHVPVALAAVGAGRHTLVEKPLAGALGSESGRLAALAAERGVTVGVAYYRRLNPTLIELRKTLAVQPVRQVEVDFRHPFDPARDHPMHWRTERSVAGGGVLADAGSHRLDLLCWLFGPPDTVAGGIADPFPGGAERTAQVRLGWSSGPVANCRFSWCAGPAADRMTITGPGGEIVLDPLDAGLAANPHTPLVIDFARAVRESTAPVCPLADASLVDTLIAVPPLRI